MSEFSPNKKNPETEVVQPEVNERLPVRKEEKLLEAHNRDTRAESLEAARSVIHETAEELSVVEQTLQAHESVSDSLPDQRSIINNDLKKVTKNLGLKSIEHKLPPTQRRLSRVIHQPIISLISEAASCTVSRPSGLMGGGLVALIGTSSYYLLAKHIGFSYNYSVFFALFIGGFVVGLLLEFLVHLLTTSKRRNTDY